MIASQPLFLSICMMCTNTSKSVVVLLWLWIRDGFIADLGKIPEVTSLASLLLYSLSPKIKSENRNLPVIYLK